MLPRVSFRSAPPHRRRQRRCGCRAASAVIRYPSCAVQGGAGALAGGCGRFTG